MGREIERMREDMDEKFVMRKRKKRRQDGEQDLDYKRPYVGTVPYVVRPQEFDKRIRGS